MDYLKERTGQPTAYWLIRIETLIRQTEQPITDEADRVRLTETGHTPN